MQIVHNLPAMNALRMQKQNKEDSAKTVRRLSSGYRVNSAADDAAGLSISEKMRSQIRGLSRGTHNAQDGASIMQVGDGALGEVHDILNRMTELSIQAANDTNTPEDRGFIQQEIRALKAEINRIAYNTEIMGCKPLLDGSAVGGEGSAASGYLTNLTGCEVMYDGRFTMGIEGATFPLAGIATPSHSYPLVSVKDTMGNSVNFRLNDMNVANLTRRRVSDDPENNLFVYSYDDGTIQFDIESHWEIIHRNTGSEVKSYYDFSYEFVNRSGTELSFDMSIVMDMIVGAASSSVPKLDGVECPGGYRYSGSNIPGQLNFDHIFSTGGGNQNINVEAVFSGPDIANTPDVVLSGNWVDVRNPVNLLGPDGQFSSATGDYFYTMAWMDRPIAAGGSYKVNGLLGVSAPWVEGAPPEAGRDQLWIQSGCKEGDGFFIPLCDARLDNLGLTDVDVSTAQGASEAIEKTEDARTKVSEFRTHFGVWNNRLEKVMDINENTGENTSAAESRIRDAKMEEEMVSYAKEKILSEVSQAMLAQAEKTPQRIVTLLEQ